METLKSLKFKKTILILQKALNESLGHRHVNQPWAGDTPEIIEENREGFEKHNATCIELESAIDILKRY